MKRSLLCVLLTLSPLTGRAAAQSGMTTPTPQQQAVINKNALALSGRPCTDYAIKMQDFPANVDASQHDLVMNVATETALKLMQQRNLAPTRVQRTPDGGGAMYFAPQGMYMQFSRVREQGRDRLGLVMCRLR